jgi:hypothetical protein
LAEFVPGLDIGGRRERSPPDPHARDLHRIGVRHRRRARLHLARAPRAARSGLAACRSPRTAQCLRRRPFILRERSKEDSAC